MEEYPECPICLDIFGNKQNHIRAPKILKCGDSICKECLEDILKNTEEEFFLCPKCKENIKKEKNIDDYVTNKLIIKLVKDCFNPLSEGYENEEGDKSIKYNIILLGDTDVGKTSIFTRLSRDMFSERHSTTIGCDTTIYYIKYKNQKYELNIRDTSGQERYKSITKNFLRNLDGVLFIYDITKKETFNNLKSWYELYKDENEKVIGVLIGNKSDCNHEVNQEEAKKFANEYGLVKYFETSAKLDKNIKKAVAYLLEEIIKVKSLENNLSSSNILIKSPKKKNKKKCNC